MSEKNEHAANLLEWADAMNGVDQDVADVCRAAAAEIERLQNRIWEIQHYPSILQEAQLRPAYVPTNPPKVLAYDVLVDGKSVAVLSPEAVSSEMERLAARVRELEQSRLLVSIDDVLAAANERPNGSES